MRKEVLLIIIFLFGLITPYSPASQAINAQWEMRATFQQQAMQSDYYHLPQEVVVGVLDTGLNYDHPDLQNRLWNGEEQYPKHGYDFTGPDLDPKSNNPHGTYVAGVITQMAPNAKIAGLRIIDIGYNPSMFIAAIKFAIRNNIKILNASLGFQDPTVISKEITKAIQEYQDFGGLLIIAAGNEQNDNDANRVYPACYRHDCIISVAALDYSGRLAYFSNWGKETVDVAAPGVAIIGPDGAKGRGEHSGTSASAPIVSALAAYIWGINPNLTAQEVKKTIMETCDFPDNLDEKLQAGKINFLSAFHQAIGQIKTETICYKEKLIARETLVNGWQKVIVKDLPDILTNELCTIIFKGDDAIEQAQNQIDFWKTKGVLRQECGCRKK